MVMDNVCFSTTTKKKIASKIIYQGGNALYQNRVSDPFYPT